MCECVTVLFVNVCGYTRMCPYARVGVFIFICMCWLRATAFRICSVRSGPVAGDPDPIRIRARCGPNTMVIRRPMSGMIRRPVPVRAVKTRRRFGSETASFHVSVCFCLIFLFTVVYMYYVLLLSFHVTI